MNKKKIFLLSSVTSYIAFAITTLIAFISVPVGLSYFGTVSYGLWIVITSITAYLSLSQFGITAGVSVFIARNSDNDFQKKTILYSLLIMGIITSSILITLLAINFFFPNWYNVIGKIPDNLKQEVSIALLALSILFLIQLPTSIFTAAFRGFQKVYWERFYLLLGSISGFISLLLTVTLKGNLITLAIFTGSGMVLLGIISGIHLFVSHPRLREKEIETPSTSLFSIKSLIITSSLFFIGSLSSIIVWNTDNIIINYFLGPQYVTSYSVTFKLISIAFAVLMLINGVIGPMYSRAEGNNEWQWIQNTYSTIITVMPILGGLVWLGAFAYARDIIYLWTGQDGYGGIIVVLTLGGYAYLLSMVNTHATLLSSLNILPVLVWAGIGEAIVNFLFSIFLVQHLGIAGVAIGTFLGSLLTMTWILPLIIYKKTQKKIAINFRPVILHLITILIPALILTYLTDIWITNLLLSLSIKGCIIIIYLIFSYLIIDPKTKSIIRNLFSKKV